MTFGKQLLSTARDNPHKQKVYIFQGGQKNMIISYLKLFFSGQLPFGQVLAIIIFAAVIVLFSLSFHEFSHAATATALGDPTAKYSGRFSVNPMRHLDPIGALCMALVGFGWAKPVPINPRNFKNSKWGMAISAVAGPVSNLIISFISAVIYCIVVNIYFRSFSVSEFGNTVFELLLTFFTMAHFMNLSLAIFNFIPVPPLDGSRILSVFLPADKYFAIMKYEKYLALGLIVLLYIGVLDGPLSFIVNGLSDILMDGASKLVSLFW